MSPSRRLFVQRALQALLVLLSVGVALYALAAYALLPLGAVLHPELRPSFAAHAPLLVYLHVFGAAVALLLWPLQLAPGLRRRRPALHRGVGWLLLLLGVGVGGVSGLLLALQAHGGPWARSGFALLALLWLASGVQALRCARQGDLPGHRRWMLRQVALALAAVTLRLLLPAGIVAGLPLALAYPLVAWLCWVPNLLLAEWLLRRGTPQRPAPERVSAAPRPASPARPRPARHAARRARAHPD